jgi:hypothetical protein
MREEMFVALFKELSRHSPGDNEKPTRNFSQDI